MYLEILCQLRNHTALQSRVQGPRHAMLNARSHTGLGLPFLIAHFGKHDFNQFRAFQKMVCNNQEPKKKGGKGLVTTNIVK